MMEKKILSAQEILESQVQVNSKASMVEIAEVSEGLKKMLSHQANGVVFERYTNLSDEMKSLLVESGFKYCTSIVVDPYGEIHEGFAILAIPK